jgi:hypothetical protein
MFAASVDVHGDLIETPAKCNIHAGVPNNLHSAWTATENRWRLRLKVSCHWGLRCRLGFAKALLAMP